MCLHTIGVHCIWCAGHTTVFTVYDIAEQEIVSEHSHTLRILCSFVILHSLTEPRLPPPRGWGLVNWEFAAGMLTANVGEVTAPQLLIESLHKVCEVPCLGHGVCTIYNPI